MIFLNLIAFSIIIILNTKSCSNNPQNYSVSTIKIRWKDNGDSTDIVMTNSMANNNWFAFGFSTDQSMVNIFIMKGQFHITKHKNLLKILF
jgi:hypothetical protein